MLDLEAIFDPDRPLPAWCAGPKSSAPVPPMVPPDRLPPDWYRRKITQVQAAMAEHKLDALVLLHAVNVIYTTGGEGFLDVIQQIDSDRYERIARIATAPGARTSLFVPEWKQFFVATPRDGDRGAELRVFQTSR